MKNGHTFAKFVIKLVAHSKNAVKSGQLSDNADTFRSIFAADASAAAFSVAIYTKFEQEIWKSKMHHILAKVQSK